jgi:hypothetical protein
MLRVEFAKVKGKSVRSAGGERRGKGFKEKVSLAMLPLGCCDVAPY